MNRRAEPSRRIDEPEPGLFKTRMVRGGPFVAARIIYDAPLWSAEIDGRPCGAADPDPAHADGVFSIWTYGARVTEAEFNVLLGRDPHPATKPIDMNAIPTMF